MKHIILAGDSVFDNRSYVKEGEPDVRDQLADLLADEDKATLIAEDGAICEDYNSTREYAKRCHSFIYKYWGQ